MPLRFNSTRTKTKRARKLRHEMTKAEGYVWNRISRRQIEGYKFRRQHPVGSYILDFYCPELKLCIELDGDQHGYDDHLIKDEKRTTYLNQHGIEVIRFWNHEVYENLENVISAIYYEVTMLALRQQYEAETTSSPPLKREG